MRAGRLARYIQYISLTGAVVLLVCLLGPASCSRAGRHERQSLSLGASYGAIWDDPKRCDEMVSHGRRLKLAPGHLRVMSWNVRWFPDGKPGNAPKESRTDVDWLACALAYHDPSLVLLQEIKLTDRGTTALARLLERLHGLTGAKWAWQADGCKVPSMQHVVLLYREDRVAVSEVNSHGELDPTGTPDGVPACPGRLRPGLGAYVKSLVGGLDFHVVNSHLDSGRKLSDFEHRQQAWALIDTVFTRRLQGTHDDDLLWGGDFNSMGCDDCSVHDSAAEVEAMSRALSALEHPLRLVSPAPRCSAYYRAKPELLDGFALSASMQEGASAQTVPSGLCAATSCSAVASEELPIFRAISDHCPLVLDLLDQDLDPEVASPAAVTPN